MQGQQAPCCILQLYLRLFRFELEHVEGASNCGCRDIQLFLRLAFHGTTRAPLKAEDLWTTQAPLRRVGVFSALLERPSGLEFGGLLERP